MCAWKPATLMMPAHRHALPMRMQPKNPARSPTAEKSNTRVLGGDPTSFEHDMHSKLSLARQALPQHHPPVPHAHVVAGSSEQDVQNFIHASPFRVFRQHTPFRALTLRRHSAVATNARCCLWPQRPSRNVSTHRDSASPNLFRLWQLAKLLTRLSWSANAKALTTSTTLTT